MDDLLAAATVLLAVVAFVALAVATWAVLRRAASLAAETRHIHAFRSASLALAGETLRLLDPLVEQVDAARRNALPMAELVPALASAATAVAELGEATRAFRPVGAAVEIRDGLEQGLGRAARAIELIEHGCALLGAGTRRGQQQEAETAVKRGYLNLVHAREAVVAESARAAALRPSEPVRLFAGRVR